jgi:hypothetical protein
LARYSANFLKVGAFIFDAESISDLYQIVRKFTAKEPTVRIALDSDHQIQSTNLQDVLDDLYVKNKNISQVQIDCMGPEDRSAHIKLRQDPFGQTVDVSIQGERAASIEARTEIENIVNGRKQWYGLPHPLVWISAWVVCLILGSTAALLLTMRGVFDTGGRSVILIGNGSFLSVFLFIALWTSVTLGLIYLLHKSFPPMLFNIGKSADRVRSAAVWRRVTFVGGILALAVGIAGSWIFEKIIK